MKKSQPTDSQRIKMLMEWGEFSKVSDFARAIGLPRGERINRILRNKNGISRDLGSMITKKFPQVNPVWLYNGESIMILPEDNPMVKWQSEESDPTYVDLMKENSFLKGKVAAMEKVVEDLCRDHRGEREDEDKSKRESA